MSADGWEDLFSKAADIPDPKRQQQNGTNNNDTNDDDEQHPTFDIAPRLWTTASSPRQTTRRFGNT